MKRYLRCLAWFAIIGVLMCLVATGLGRQSTPGAAVVSGFLVFVSGQFVLKLVLEPVVSFKESLGALSAFCLANSAGISNANASKAHRAEFREVKAAVLSKKAAVPWYTAIAFLLALPEESALRKADELLNEVGYGMVGEGRLSAIETTQTLRNAGQLLGIRVFYGS